MPLYLGGGVSSEVNRRPTGLSEWAEREIRELSNQLRPHVVTIAPPTTDGTSDGLLGATRYRVVGDQPRIYTLALSENSKPQWRELLSRKTDSGEPYTFFENSTDDMTLHDGSLVNIENAGAGDASIQFELTGGQVYSLGTDNSASDIFQLYDVTAGQKLWHYDSDGLDIASGDAYHINNTSVLTATTLGGAVVNSSLTSLGTIATGVWEGTDVGLAHGGTGASLSDPGADRIFFWDDGGTTTGFLAPGDGVEISGTNLLVDLNTTNLKFTSNEIDTIQSIATGASVQFEHLGLGGARTEGYLHINPGAAGSVTANASWDDLVIEGSGSTGISVLGPPTDYKGIVFGESTDAFAAALLWYSTTLQMSTYNTTSAQIQFRVSSGLVALTLGSDKNATFVGDLRVDGGDIGISGDTDLMQLAANSLTVNGDIILSDNSLTGVDTIAFTDTAGTIAGIQNQNLVDKSATENVTGTWQIARLGINGAITEGELHVNPGAAGSVTASSGWNSVVIEDSATAAITILGHPSYYKGIVFGDSYDSFAAALLWHQSSHVLSLNCYNTAAAKIQFRVAQGYVALTLESSLDATFVGDIRVDGGDIGTTGDNDLIQLATNQVDINGSLDVNGTVPVIYMMETDGSADENWAFTVDGGELYISTATDAKSKHTRVLIRRDGALLCDNVSSNPATPSNTAGIFAKDVSFSAECFTIDEADNVTQISPHDPLTGETYLNTYNTRTNRSLILRNERFIRRMIAKYPGEFDDCIEEFDGEYGHSS